MKLYYKDNKGQKHLIAERKENDLIDLIKIVKEDAKKKFISYKRLHLKLDKMNEQTYVLLVLKEDNQETGYIIESE